MYDILPIHITHEHADESMHLLYVVIMRTNGILNNNGDNYTTAQHRLAACADNLCFFRLICFERHAEDVLFQTVVSDNGTSFYIMLPKHWHPET